MKHARRHGAIQHDEPAVDFGTTGPAQQARPCGTGETIQAGVTYRLMHDTHPLDVWDRTAKLTERQIDAGWKLTAAFITGKFAQRAVTPAYGAARGGDSSPEAAVAMLACARIGAIHSMTIARQNYGLWMDHAPDDCKHTLGRIVRGEGGAYRMWLVRKALDAVADEMRLPRETFTNGKGWSA